MARRLEVKKRGNKKRRQKVVYLIIAEGRNKTETLYLSNFQEQSRNFIIRFVKAGSNTDAESLYKTMLKKWKELGLDAGEGDRGFIVLDMDNDKLKAEKIIELNNKKSNSAISFITSNPAFEIWFLLHFKYTTKFYRDCDSVISDLKKYIPNYDKNVDCFPVCEDMTQKAIKNAEKLGTFFSNEIWPSVECNPRTDVMELVKLLMEDNER
ncbi:MAG: RloB family protein [Pseudobutyrivibrio sp.]|nr:RloB family protein [Pseudobutyrivibrio sp.]